ncbi:ASNSD1 upstream open reading frame protein [Pseudophryne corroboree]|uniref:ASNSD1 upstream open reading frame protein n=1 Tax=Pseudophryne corroboree TaxID=495146 RepID=UPI003081DFDE
MSGSITGGTEDCSSWTDRQREEFSAQYREQTVLLDELSNLKNDRRVYKQQRNSNIYFLADKSKTLSECKKTLDDMKPTYRTFENTEKTEVEN